MSEDENTTSKLPSRRIKSSIHIPIVGRVVPNNPGLVPKSDFNYLDSGDVLIMERVSEVNNGEMAAVWLADREETTLKYFFREKKRIRLQPANTTMGPIYVDDPSMIKIQGRVIAIIKLIALESALKEGLKDQVINGENEEFSNIQTITLKVTNADNGISKLTPSFLENSVNPFLTAINHLQKIANQIKNLPVADIAILNISQNSPITINLGNAKDAIDAIRSVVVPWRRKHAEQMALLAERKEKIEIEKNKASILEINAQIRGIEENRELERSLKREEIRKLQLENERVELELQREKIILALEILAKIGPHLSEQETSNFVTDLIPTITVLVSSDIEIKTPAT